MVPVPFDYCFKTQFLINIISDVQKNLHFVTLVKYSSKEKKELTIKLKIKLKKLKIANLKKN